MDPANIGMISVGILLGGVFLGFHIAFAMIAVSILGIWLITGNLGIGLSILGSAAYMSLSDYVFGAAPMFIIMGLLSNLSGASEDLYDAANVLFGRIRGGQGITTVMANAVFAAVTGASIVSAAVFSKIALPQMLRLGYQKRFALGTVAGSSILGMLIPPSMYFIIYGILAGESIGKLFVAGILPGILLCAFFVGGILFLAYFRPEWVGKGKNEVDLKNRRWTDLLKGWGVAGLVLLTLGGIYLGYFTPTEAGAMGALGALLLCIIKKKLTLTGMWYVLKETGENIASIYFLILGAMTYSRMLTFSGLPAELSTFFSSLNVPPLTIIALFVLWFIVLGCVLDSGSMMLMNLPIMLPVAHNMGFDLIWFGVIVVVAIEMGLLTPPFGLVVFTMKASINVDNVDVSVEDIFIGSFPFFLIIGLTLIVLMFFPNISLWLPSQM